MKYKLIIFDLDGTVLDTLGDLCDSVNFALRKHGLPERSLDEIRAFVGNGIRRLIDLSVPKNTDVTLTDSVFNDFREYYREHSSIKTKPYEGIIDLLAELKSNGCYTAVISNKADFAVKKLTEEYFGDLFSYSAGEKEGVPRKPEPDSVHLCMKHFGITPEETVYIGDSEVDIKTAENVGIDSILVTWGFRSKVELIKNGAKTLVSDMGTLKQLLTE